jgi:hypothetical protein
LFEAGASVAAISLGAMDRSALTVNAVLQVEEQPRLFLHDVALKAV